jgi:uncharacterized damage-inducible protein DinB
VGVSLRSAASLHPDWPQYSQRLTDAIRDLTPEQLAIRASPTQLPIWAIVAHTASMRLYWLCSVFGEPGADRTPFPDPTGEGWEDDEDHPRSAAELVWALDSTWEVVEACLDRWTIESLDMTAERVSNGVVQVHTRASLLDRMGSHEAYHAGEISQLLGAHGLAQIDLWAPGT